MRHIDSMASLIERAAGLAVPGARHLLGITGPPGAGKSTLAEALVAELGGLAVLVPMDGFHLSNGQLVRLGRRQRKGAPDTFDAAGYVALLLRLAAGEDGTVFAPEFRRQLEEPIAGAIAVAPEVPLVITEGNYLLMDRSFWSRVRGLLDESWYVDIDPTTRVERLIERHVRFGKARAEAEAWVHESDEVNARAIAATRHLADVTIGAIDLGSGAAQPADRSQRAARGDAR